MTLVGIALLAVGFAGGAANHFGLIQFNGVLADMKLWIGLAVVGGIVVMLNRRTSD
jgi:hypothetical protein